MLSRSANGFGALALMGLLGGKAFGNALSSTADPARKPGPLAPRPPHFVPRARNVVFLYMDGGPSQVDTFDPKPRLQKESGQPFKMKMEPTQFNDNGLTLGTPRSFRNCVQAGLPATHLFRPRGQFAYELSVA